MNSNHWSCCVKNGRKLNLVKVSFSEVLLLIQMNSLICSREKESKVSQSSTNS